MYVAVIAHERDGLKRPVAGFWLIVEADRTLPRCSSKLYFSRQNWLFGPQEHRPASYVVPVGRVEITLLADGGLRTT